MRRAVFPLIFLILLVESTNFSGKSYYFKTIGNNEFSVYNRVHFLNHNISDFDANPHGPQENRKIEKNIPSKDVTRIVSPKSFFLDQDWNYIHKPLNKSNFPFFIKKIYEQNRTDTVKIFFNANRNSSSPIIKFDLEALRSEENVSDADMYFYWPLENTSSIYKTSVVLRLYQFEKQFDNNLNDTILMENPDVHKLFNVIYISKAQKGWQTFKIKKPVDNWSNGEQNLGLLLTISSYDENKLISVFNDTNEGLFRTFAVLNILKNDSNHIQNRSMPSPSLKTPQLNAGCSKRPWNLDFRHLNWDKFILYPEGGIMTYQCSGKCHGEENIITNHAKVKQFANPGFREKVCCVPVEYDSVPIMYVDKFGNVILKNYDNMIVKKCGCR